MTPCTLASQSSTILLSGQQKKGGLCMLGGIYTPEKCALCGLQMRDNGRNAVACPQLRQ